MLSFFRACLGITLLGLGAFPAAQELQLRERTLGVMGTELEVKVLGTDVAALDAALDAAIAEIRRVEDLMTDWRPSPLTELNAAAGKGPQQVPRELLELIQRAKAIGDATRGAFDITYAGVGRLWDFKADPPVVPSQEAVTEALAKVDYRRIEIDEELGTVAMPAGFSIGLGGIAKGYGVDRAMAVFLDRGIEHGYVSAGGDLKALGLKFGEPWRIAIRHPRDQERVLALVPVSNKCVVTSGDYERFFTVDGKRYHHILDPRTGFPSEGCISATIVAPDAATADALATAMCVLGPERGMAIIEKLPRIEALMVGLDGTVHTSAGLSGAD